VTFAHLAFQRVVRSRSAWLASAGWSAFILVAAGLQRSHAAPHGADHALDLYSSLALPLLVYALVGAAVGRGTLAGSGRALVRLGGSSAHVALATVVVTMAASALVGGALGAGAVAVAHGSGDPPVVTDSIHTLAFGALAAAAYAAYFMVGASLLAGFWGRALFLVVDWVLGSDDGFGALLTPRGHLGNLLGGEAPFEALPWESLAALATIAVVCAALSVRRASLARV